MSLILPFQGVRPSIHPQAWVAPGATLVGDVRLGAEASVWYGCVLRGDVMPIEIGARSNIQDGSVVHVTRGRAKTEIGEDVLVGHMAIIHGCTLAQGAFVGLGAIVMDHGVIEEDGMLAAGAMLTPGKRVGRRELWAGRPARMVRMLSDEEVAQHRAGTAGYVELARLHRASLAGQAGGQGQAMVGATGFEPATPTPPV